MTFDRRRVIFWINADLWFGIFWYQNLCRFMVGMLSVCYRFEFGIVGLLSVSIPALCWWSVSNRCYVGYLSVSNRAIPYRILPEMSPTRTRLVLRCLQQHCRWPTAGRLIENFAVFVSFVSVWPVWLGHNYKLVYFQQNPKQMIVTVAKRNEFRKIIS